jgi:hypothetical protein
MFNGTVAHRTASVVVTAEITEGPHGGKAFAQRDAPGYFQMMADFIRNGRIGAHYGEAAITQPSR